ncbi:MAG: histidine--tRNA ligase [Parachlamydiaceae bacterium]
MKVPIAPGVYDILPVDSKDLWKSSYLWSHLESTIRDLAKSYGFQEIRTPLFERTELLHRAVGETTDIVSKEMYTFIDKGNRSLSLRPEGTAPVMRAFIENQLHTTSPVHKLFYICPMFRYERTQAGRYRQHHQFGTEVVGADSPEQDAELIDLLWTLYQRLGLKDLQIYINSLGDPSCRLAFRESLQSYLKTHYDHLSEDSKTRFHANPLRILDSKDPKDQEIVAQAPNIIKSLNEASREHFESVQKLLRLLKIPFEINPCLVRGLDYYNRTVFEITAGQLGAQNSIAGGGRYDGMLKTLGGPDLPSIGFGTGLERVLQTMINQGAPLPQLPAPFLFIIPLGDSTRETCFKILHILRQKGVSVEMDFSRRKLNKVMQYANQIGAHYITVVGDDELQKEEISFKEMSTGTVTKVRLDQVETAIQGLKIAN